MLESLRKQDRIASAPPREFALDFGPLKANRVITPERFHEKVDQPQANFQNRIGRAHRASNEDCVPDTFPSGGIRHR
jgi:hypothetical protein